MELSPVFPMQSESNISTPAPPEEQCEKTTVQVNEVLKGVVAFVEVRSHAENRSQAIALELEELGAVVSNRLNAGVTHVIFREGRKRTKDWSERHSVPLVSVGWILACKRALRRISESNFLVLQPESGSDDASPLTGFPARRRLRSMQPKDLDEDLKLSAERKKRNARRNAKRNDLHRRAVEAENCLRTYETEVTRNYYANPCIRVPLTPPSMKEYAERKEQRRGSSDSESTVSRRSSFHLSTDIQLPRRRLFASPSVTVHQSGEDQTESHSPFLSAWEVCKISAPDDSTLVKESAPHRRLFNAAAYEASGVLIEPKHSSHRLQDISKVFPKSFRKRKIDKADKKVKKKKLITIVDDDESDSAFADHVEELDFSTVTKSRRLSAQKSNVDGIQFKVSSPNNSAHDSPCTSSMAKNLTIQADVHGYGKSSVSERENLKSSTESERLHEGESDTEEEINDIGTRVHRVTVESDEQVSDIAGPSNVSDIAVPRNEEKYVGNTEHDVLEIIDQTTKFRDFIKKLPQGYSLGVRRKSVRFSDEIDEDIETDLQMDSTGSDSKVAEADVTDFSKKKRVKRKGTSGSVKPQLCTIPDSAEVASLSPEHHDAAVRKLPVRINLEISNIGILAEAEATQSAVSKMETNSMSSVTPGSPKRRRSSRLSVGKPQMKPLESTSKSSSSSKLSAVNRSRQEKSAAFVGDSSDSSYKGSRSEPCKRLRYSDELSTSSQGEKAYGVLVVSNRARRSSKRLSVASVLKALTESHNSSSNDSSSKTPEIMAGRRSLDDFKQSESCSETSSSGHRSTSHGKRRLQESNIKNSPRKNTTHRIVFTSLHKNEQETAKKAISALGGGRIYNSVVCNTTHVVTTWPVRRTLNLLRAVLYGCHVVTLSWLIESRQAGRWLPENRYTIHEVPTPEKNPSIRRIFNSFKGIYVENGVSPPQKELKTLIELAGGKVDASVSTSPKNASVIVSSQSGDSTAVSPKWILDSIMESEALPFDEYQLQ